jgi:hypothetical protein
MLGVMIAYPWIAVAVGTAFAALWTWRRARSAAVAAGLWLAYAGYESLMLMRVLCSGECNIRVDLLLFYPLLLAVSLVALWRTWRSRPREGAPTR